MNAGGQEGPRIPGHGRGERGQFVRSKLEAVEGKGGKKEERRGRWYIVWMTNFHVRTLRLHMGSLLHTAELIL